MGRGRVAEAQWEIVLDLDLLSHFDFFWDDFADRVGYHAPGIPEDWKERELHPELTSWGEVSSINAGLTELGQVVCEVLADEYLDWEAEEVDADDLPDFCTRQRLHSGVASVRTLTSSAVNRSGRTGQGPAA